MITHVKCPAAALCEVQRMASLTEERFKQLVEHPNPSPNPSPIPLSSEAPGPVG